MDNSEKYNFADFTTENYRRLVRLAKNNYNVSDFFNYKDKDNFVIWRHDVDFSMHRALKMARIENEEGVKATYFVLLHSEFYNLLEREVSDLLRNIIALGHEIGLHFDSHYYDIKNDGELVDKLNFEKDLLERTFDIKVRTFCFHINNDFTLNCKKDTYAGLVNAFSEHFQKNVDYCSDSNGYWRFQRLEDVLKNNAVKQLQVLTHPELWQDEIMSPKQRVYRCADLRAQKTKKWYDDVLAKNARENIDWR